MMKRLLALLLAVTLLVGLMPTTAVFAAGGNEDIYIDGTASLEDLEELGILDYENQDPEREPVDIPGPPRE